MKDGIKSHDPADAALANGDAVSWVLHKLGMSLPSLAFGAGAFVIVASLTIDILDLPLQKRPWLGVEAHVLDPAPASVVARAVALVHRFVYHATPGRVVPVDLHPDGVVDVVVQPVSGQGEAQHYYVLPSGTIVEGRVINLPTAPKGLHDNVDAATIAGVWSRQG